MRGQDHHCRWVSAASKHSVCDVSSSPHWASAVEGHEPHKEDWDDFAGKLRLIVCLYPAPLGEEGFLPSCNLCPPPSCPTSQDCVWTFSSFRGG